MQDDVSKKLYRCTGELWQKLVDDVLSGGTSMLFDATTGESIDSDEVRKRCSRFSPSL
jgi:hypothetical protein